MRAIAPRYWGFGGLLLGVAAALLVSWRSSHWFFGAIAGCMLVFVAMVAVGLNVFRQTDVDHLSARGISVAADEDFSMDTGLQREFEFATPPNILRRRPGTGPRLAAPHTAATAKPARLGRTGRSGRTGRTGRLNEPPLLDGPLTIAAERSAASIDDVYADLDHALIGLVPVKRKVHEIGSLLLVDRARQRFGLSGPRPNLHMCFTGAPGTGKTTVALMMAELLHRLGYLEKGHLVHAMRDDLVGQYIGHTAPKTKRVLERAMGGVLFIDEAYTLYRAEDSRDYGQECIDILLQVMENQRERLVVILAGYKDRMDYFFECNPGMSSRIAHHLDFASYQVDELLAIGRLMLDEASYYMSPEAEAAFREYLRPRMSEPRFGNARSVRNELEGARLRHADRLAADPERHLSKDDLMRLEPTDIVPAAD